MTMARSILIMCAYLVACTVALQVHVSKTGSDTGACEVSTPCATVQYAITTQATASVPSIDILVGPGSYELDQPITIGSGVSASIHITALVSTTPPVFDCNTNAFSGFAISTDSTVLIDFVTIQNCKGSAGVEITNTGAVTFQNCSVLNNKVGFSITGSTATISGCTIKGNANMPEGLGAGFAFQDSTANVVDCLVTANGAGMYGGAAFVNSSSVSFTRTTITYNSAYNGGGLYVMMGAVANLEDCTLSYNTNKYTGSAMAVLDAAAHLTRTTMTYNIASTQSCLYANNSVITIDSSNISSNTNVEPTYGWPAGVIIYYSTTTLRASTFSNNSNQNVIVKYGDVNITDCTISHTEDEGLYLARGKAIIEGCVIENNGIGLRMLGSQHTVRNTRIANNVNPLAQGAGIFVFAGAVGVFINTTITGNTGRWGGGATITTSKVDFVNSSITNNVATKFGGGINMMFCDLCTFTNTRITGNQAATEGGGVYSYQSLVTITDSLVSGNTAGANGGGVYTGGFGFPLVPATTHITNTPITLNSADFGGGLYFVEHFGTIAGLALTNNTARVGAGAVIANSSTHFEHVQIAYNKATGSGGGMVIQDANVTVTNLVFDTNSAVYVGGGVLVDNSNLELQNTVVVNNGPNGMAQARYQGSAKSTVTASNTTLDRVNFLGMCCDPNVIDTDTNTAVCIFTPETVSCPEPISCSCPAVAVDSPYQFILAPETDCNCSKSLKDGEYQTAKSLFVSDQKGSDIPSCGNQSSPCRSIIYAIGKSFSAQTDIWVDTGAYSISTTITFADVTIPQVRVMAWNTSLVNPIVICTSKTFPAFQVANGVSLYLGNMDVSSCKIGVQAKDASVILQNCKINTNTQGVSAVDSSMRVLHSTILGNAGALYGAGLYYQNSTGVIDSSVITGNSAQLAGGAIYLNASSPSIVSTSFGSNVAQGGEGGAIGIQDSSTSISDATFLGHSQVIQCSYSTVTLTRVNFNGGTNAWTSNYSTVSFSSVSFSNYAAPAAVFLYDNVQAVGFTFTGCTQTPVKMTSTNATITASKFSNNVGALGGAILASLSNLTLSNSIIANSSASTGGAIHLGFGQLQMFSTNVTNNNATGNAGGLMITNSEFTLLDCQFVGNKAAYGGGAYIQQSTGSITNCTVTMNAASVDAGGMRWVSSSVTMSGGAVANNVASLLGGGIATDNQFGPNTVASEISGTSFVGNAAKKAGALFVSIRDSVKLTKGDVTQNSADIGGGVIVANATLVVSGITFTKNTATHGAALYFHNSTGQLLKSSFSQNAAQFLGGALLIVDSPIEINETLMMGNGNNSISRVIQPSIPAAQVTFPSWTTAVDGTFIKDLCCDISGLNNTQNLAICSYICNDVLCPTAIGCACDNTDFFSYESTSCSCSTRLDTCPPRPTPKPTPKPTPTPTPQYVCGNNITEPGEECDSLSLCCDDNCKFVLAGVACRASRGVCDAEDFCTGKSDTCLDVTQPSTFFCSINTTKCGISGICGSSISTCPPVPSVSEDKCGVCGGDGTSCTERGSCGDSFCNPSIGENCTSCLKDCGACIVPVACYLNCSYPHGVCNKGLCTCNDHWSGTGCETLNEIVVPTPSDTDPSVVIVVGTNSSQANVTFNVAVRQIREVKPNGQVVASFDLNKGDLQVTENVTSFSKSWIYTTTFNNSAQASFSFLMVSNITTISFANESFSLIPNTLKSTIYVYNWPFEALSNSLEVVMNLDVPKSDSCETDLQLNEDASGNLRSLRYTVNGQSFVGKYLDVALVDGNPRPLQVALSPAREITLSLAHFWSYVAIDPDFSVIIDPRTKDACGEFDNGGKNNTVTIVVSAVVVGLAVLAAVIGVAIRTYRRRMSLKRIHSGVQNALITDNHL